MLQKYEKIAELITKKQFFLTFLCLSFFVQAQIFAQNDKLVTIHKNGITVIDALKEVEKQSKLSINYSDSDLKSKTIKSLNLQKTEINKALNAILKETGFTYKIQGNYVVITPEKSTKKKVVKKIRGQVKDENGEPLIGVNIAAEGATTGSITDFDGNFTLEAAEQSTFKVSYIGYVSQTIRVTDKNDYAIVLKQDTEVLDEVVVTALGIKRAEKALSYNVQKVSNSDLTVAKDANFMNSLNGKVAGVNIQRSSSGVGGATRVVMRGSKSIVGNNNALYVIDGMPVGNPSKGVITNDYGAVAGSEGISDFNPDDIESISVLTGPSAAALYGSAAANGAILINTKKGAEGKMRVNFSSNTDFSAPLLKPEFQNTFGNRENSYRSWGGINWIHLPPSTRWTFSKQVLTLSTH